MAAEPNEGGFTLFLVGFLELFFELACIRWFAANVIFLQFFINVVLIATFLGMSCGCLARPPPSRLAGEFSTLSSVGLAGGFIYACSLRSLGKHRY